MCIQLSEQLSKNDNFLSYSLFLAKIATVFLFSYFMALSVIFTRIMLESLHKVLEQLSITVFLFLSAMVFVKAFLCSTMVLCLKLYDNNEM